MGAAWSYMDPVSSMRLASREVCDDETWANTVQNRSACSVQERLNMLENGMIEEQELLYDDAPQSESYELASPTTMTKHRNRSLEFSETNSVLVFTVEHPVEEEVVSSDDDSLDSFDIDTW